MQPLSLLTNPYATISSDDKILYAKNLSYQSGVSYISYIKLFRINNNGVYDTSFGESSSQILPPILTEKHCESVDIVSNTLYLSGVGFNYQNSYYNNSIFVAKLNLNTSLNTNENNVEKDFSFYPNPATNSIIFNTIVSSISIYSLDGKRVLVEKDKQEIDVSGLSKGIYLLKGVTAEGEQFSKKLIKN